MRPKLLVAAVTLLAAGSAGAAALTGCGVSACPAVAEQAFQLDVRNESGDRVDPEELQVSHDGTTEQESWSCRGARNFGYWSGGQYTVTATCGDVVRSKTFRVKSDDCGPITKDVELTFPDGACTSCADDSPGTDAGDTGPETDAGDV